MLIKEKADFNICSKVLSILSHLVITQDINIYCEQDGFTPVYIASHEGHTAVVDTLLKAGADIHLATTKVHTRLIPMHTQNSSLDTQYTFCEFKGRRQGIAVEGEGQ